METGNTIPKVTIKELSKVENPLITSAQLKLISGKTPERYIRTRPGKGGGTFRYVSTGYMTKVLNLLFGWDWDFEIVNEMILSEEGIVVVKGKLTCRRNGRQIVKMQFGRKDITYKKGTKQTLDLGNDLKAAASDALKKCASEIGIASDIYAAEDFKEIQVVDSESNIEEKQDKQNRDNTIDHIVNSKTLESLRQAESYIQNLTEDDEIVAMYKAKERNLS